MKITKKSSFETTLPSLDDKIKFLQTLDLINLQKAAKIGKISSSKIKNRRDAIKSIIKFDLKNKFLISKNIFNNLKEYTKDKIDDIHELSNLEWNQHEYDQKKTQEWELIKDDISKEIEIPSIKIRDNWAKAQNENNSSNKLTEAEVVIETLNKNSPIEIIKKRTETLIIKKNKNKLNKKNIKNNKTIKLETLNKKNNNSKLQLEVFNSDKEQINLNEKQIQDKLENYLKLEIENKLNEKIIKEKIASVIKENDNFSFANKNDIEVNNILDEQIQQKVTLEIENKFNNIKNQIQDKLENYLKLEIENKLNEQIIKEKIASVIKENDNFSFANKNDIEVNNILDEQIQQKVTLEIENKFKSIKSLINNKLDAEINNQIENKIKDVIFYCNKYLDNINKIREEIYITRLFVEENLNNNKNTSNNVILEKIEHLLNNTKKLISDQKYLNKTTKVLNNTIFNGDVVKKIKLITSIKGFKKEN